MILHLGYDVSHKNIQVFPAQHLAMQNLKSCKCFPVVSYFLSPNWKQNKKLIQKTSCSFYKPLVKKSLYMVIHVCIWIHDLSIFASFLPYSNVGRNALLASFKFDLSDSAAPTQLIAMYFCAVQLSIHDFFYVAKPKLLSWDRHTSLCYYYY